MLPVEILPFQENVILRAGGSELLIISVHVRKLQQLKKPRDFSQYFKDEALVNRPARKLFEAWLRKDGTLWPRLYKTVQAIPLAEQPSQSENHSLAADRNPEPQQVSAQENVELTAKDLEKDEGQSPSLGSMEANSGSKKTRPKAKAEQQESQEKPKKKAAKSKPADHIEEPEKTDNSSKKKAISKKTAQAKEDSLQGTPKKRKTQTDKEPGSKSSKETKTKKKG